MSGVVFHGTLGDCVAGVRADGIRVRAGEPSFTLDPALACCRYAHPGYNTKRFYTGTTLAAARLLAAQGLIRCRGDDDMLADARTYWDAHAADGVVFVIAADHWQLRTGTTAHLSIDPNCREVHGGLTRWIESHVALFENDLPTERVPPERLIAELPSTPQARQSLSTLSRWAVGLEAYEIVVPALDNLRQAANAIAVGFLSGIRRTAIRTALRRGFLSILRAQGYRMFKSDHVPPYEEDAHVFWRADEIDRRLEALHQPAMMEGVGNAWDRLHRLHRLAEAKLEELHLYLESATAIVPPSPRAR